MIPSCQRRIFMSLPVVLKLSLVLLSDVQCRFVFIVDIDLIGLYIYLQVTPLVFRQRPPSTPHKSDNNTVIARATTLHEIVTQEHDHAAWNASDGQFVNLIEYFDLLIVSAFRLLIHFFEAVRFAASGELHGAYRRWLKSPPLIQICIAIETMFALGAFILPSPLQELRLPCSNYCALHRHKLANISRPKGADSRSEELRTLREVV
mmetsp:Transcript_8572/g.14030  ORF Transcript_8572/g.14030 Transcript_8572/m.14030 type:complete len:206 (+) Transcript_8572:3716-4333(+)